jgi:pimeloyl-[acyl-carrier protein] methyl ester esterase
MKIKFVLCHGWGYKKSFWDNLFKDQLQKYSTIILDIGYFQSPHLPKIEKEEDTLLIGIGHSSGLIHLSKYDARFDLLIGINSFVDFLGHFSPFYDLRLKELEHMIKAFKINPSITIKRFHNRCGREYEFLAEHLNRDLSLSHLELLKTSFSLQPQIPTLILSTKNDLVVPPEIIYYNFKDYSNVEVETLDMAYHVPSLYESTLLYSKILNFISSAYHKKTNR